MFTETFKGLKGGDRIRYLAYAGLGRNGAEYKEKVGRVQHMLTFHDHVVVNAGRGIPVVVDERNYVGRA